MRNKFEYLSITTKKKIDQWLVAYVQVCPEMKSLPTRDNQGISVEERKGE